MFSELVRALLAAVLVGVVPGYYWARCFVSTADRAERIAYSAALSLTLVPATALLQARLFDTGITFIIAVVSTMTVFLAGIVLYLVIGAASHAVEPLTASEPAPLSSYALAPLLVAFGLMLGAALGLVPEDRYAVPIALLVLVAGIVNFLVSRAGPARPGPSQEAFARTGWRVVRRLALPVVVLFALVRGYLGPVLHDWPFIRGGDQFSHAVMSNLMMTEGEIDQYLTYPPGFHILIALVSRLSQLEPLEVFPVLAPALTVLPALGCYALARRLWGWGPGVAAAFFSSLLLVGPYESFVEARYPNLVSADFLIVMAVAALVGVYNSSTVRSGLVLAVLGSSVVLYHPVASLYLALLLALVAALLFPYLLIGRYKRSLIALVLSLSLLGFLSALYAWDTYDAPRLIGGLLDSSEAGASAMAVTNTIGTQEPLSLRHLMETTSSPVLWLGLLGALVAMGDLLRRRVSTPQALTYLTLLLWALAMFAGSRTSLSGFPQRFERDLGMPLAVFAALSFVTILCSPVLSRPKTPLPATLVAIPVAALAIVVAGMQVVHNLGSAGTPSNNVISPQVAAAGEWLADHKAGRNLILTPYFNNHTPGSAMLALGGYEGLRSYTQKRIRVPRALPPSGKGPLLDAQWVQHHPGGERTRSILEKYDIGYVVLSKGYPGVPWRAFLSRPDLYEKTFENGAVVIFAPRETALSG